MTLCRLVVLPPLHAQVRNVQTGEITDLQVNGLFFAIGHEPATKFLNGQVRPDAA